MKRTIILTAAILALGVSGGAVAAGKITGAGIKDNTITSRDVKNRSLRALDFKRGQLPRGEQGPVGPQGPAGPINVGGIVRTEASTVIAPFDLGSVTANCPPGHGLISGGFRSASSDGEAFFADDFGGRSSWSIGFDNFDSSVEADVTAVAFCAPSGKAVIASRASIRRQVDRLVEKQRASHEGEG